MGSAALYHLARRGRRVLGLERFDVLARARLVARADADHPPRVLRAPRLRAAPPPRLRALARARVRGRRAAPPRSPGSSRAASTILDGVLRSCAEHDLPHEVTRRRARSARRFPAYRLPDDLDGRLPAGRWLPRPRALHRRPRRGRARARRRAAGARARARVGGRPRAASVVRTDRGTVEAERLVLDRRRVVAGRRAARRRARSRAFARSSPGSSRRGPELFSPTACRSSTSCSTASTTTGSPSTGSRGFEARPLRAAGRRAATRTRSRASRTLEDEAPLRAFAERYFPDGAGAHRRAQDVPLRALARRALPRSTDIPTREHAVVGAGFSGHGFKFCSVVGEILADLALDGETRHDIGLFRLDRFAYRSLERAGDRQPQRRLVVGAIARSARAEFDPA